jgi:protein-tyrosine phosphatase
VIDLHTHILPGLDDGPVTLEGSVAFARAAVADGTQLVAATPHVRDDYPTRADAMLSAVARLRQALADEAIALDVHPGGEIALGRLGELGSDELASFGLAGNPRYLLVEFPYHGWPFDLGARLLELSAAGITPVLAHPERNPDVANQLDRVGSLVEAGVLLQATAASLDGRGGRRVRSVAFELVERGWVHMVASDAHTPAIRQVGLTPAAHAIGDPDLAAWLTEGVPGAIVAGAELPERPAPSPRRRLGWGRRGR